MQINGKNLALAREAIDLAMSDVHNQIATCPDVFELAAELDELDAKKAELEKLGLRMDKAIAKENAKQDV